MKFKKSTIVIPVITANEVADFPHRSATSAEVFVWIKGHCSKRILSGIALTEVRDLTGEAIYTFRVDNLMFMLRAMGLTGCHSPKARKLCGFIIAARRLLVPAHVPYPFTTLRILGYINDSYPQTGVHLANGTQDVASNLPPAEEREDNAGRSRSATAEPAPEIPPSLPVQGPQYQIPLEIGIAMSCNLLPIEATARALLPSSAFPTHFTRPASAHESDNEGE
ncbi:hypothetical protein ONS95_009981 [Cadophora gregata]|uniref:uncharacterized protein n=1 Tax=Cadophora gregata TaxID=51156 RepID=UPI0026DB46C8|nr:uncharacterized protein ONS95_009981 [Cadophora gregata]KAK0121696.1 hypothetical protein ONS95_009981 [Cadophora gregata]